jgi:hypothetical protein
MLARDRIKDAATETRNAMFRNAILISSVAALAAASGVAADHYSREVPFGLALRGAPADTSATAAPHLWYFCQPTDLQGGLGGIDSLDAIALGGRANVTVVLMLPQRDTTVGRDMSSVLSGHFDLEIDSTGVWSKRLAAGGLNEPLYALRSDGRLAVTLDASAGRTVAEVLAALAGGPARFDSLLEVAGSNTPPQRHLLSRSLDLVSRIGRRGPAALKRPELIAMSGATLAVYDFGDMALKGFGLTGASEWVSGGRRGNQQFYTLPFDLTSNGDGFVLLDQPTHTAVRISAKGVAQQGVRLSREVGRVALAAHGILGFQDFDSTVAGYLFDSDGTVIRAIPRPTQLRSLSPMLQQAWLTSLPGSDSGAVAFASSGLIGVVDGAAGTMTLSEGVEPLPFPAMLAWKRPDGGTMSRVDPSAPQAALSIAADRDFIYVLFGGRTRRAGRVIDVYSHQARYIGSYVLPDSATKMIRTPTGFVTTSASSDGSGVALEVWRLGH